jgi:hypothetical protein
MKVMNRRTLLRGAGISLALPTLDAMIDGRGRWFFGEGRALAAPPVRVMAFHFPHGVNGQDPYWTPKTTGQGYALTPLLMPLAAYQNDFNLISGVSQNAVRAGGVGGGHARGMPCFATAAISTDAGAGGPSFDQQLANEFGSTTKFTSIVANNEKPGTITEGATTAHMNNIAWSQAGKFVPSDRDPLALFSRLVAQIPSGPATTGPSAPVAAAAAQKRSVLDHVTQEVTALGGKVGTSDRARLDDYLTGLREIERQLLSPATVAAGCRAPDAPTSMSDDPVPRAQTFLRLIATAFKCDLTRYASFAMSNGFDTRVYPQISTANHHHQLTHSGGNGDIERKFALYFAGFLATLMGDLKNTPEGAGTVLDNSLIYYGSEMATGSHATDGMPIILAGRAGGRIDTGRHIRLPAATPMAKLFLTLLKVAGSSAKTFGMDGTDVVPGIAA